MSQTELEGGEAGMGGSSHALGGSSAAHGGRSSIGVAKAGAGSAGVFGSGGGVSGSAGHTGLVFSADAAGEAAGGAGAGSDHGDCFAPLGKGLRCEGAEAHAQGPNLERVPGAATLSDCQAACLMRPDCLGVSDYLTGEMLVNACYLRHTPCGKPGTGDWHEEDGGKEYVKVCPTADNCHFEYLGDWIRCEDESQGAVDTSLTSNLQACNSACLTDPTCTSVTDYFYLNQVQGCYLYTGTCSAPGALPFGDPGQAYVRRPCGTQ